MNEPIANTVLETDWSMQLNRWLIKIVRATAPTGAVSYEYHIYEGDDLIIVSPERYEDGQTAFKAASAWIVQQVYE